MDNPKRVHIIANGKGWAVKKEGLSRASKIYQGKEDAIKYTLKLYDYDTIVHKRDGSIERVQTMADKLVLGVVRFVRAIMTLAPLFALGKGALKGDAQAIMKALNLCVEIDGAFSREFRERFGVGLSIFRSQKAEDSKAKVTGASGKHPKGERRQK